MYDRSPGTHFHQAEAGGYLVRRITEKLDEAADAAQDFGHLKFDPSGFTLFIFPQLKRILQM
jgi:hypothetical protein